MRKLLRTAGALTLMGALAPAAGHAQERYALGGEHVAIYNLAGEIEVVGTTSGQVTVEVRRGGRDSGDLRVEVGRTGGTHALRVVYPSQRVVYQADTRSWLGSGRWLGSRSTTQLNVREDGTWGGDGPRGRSVRISTGGSGMEAHADLRVGVPRGQRVDLHLGVGRVNAENVDGRVHLQTSSGAIAASRMAGALVARTGSGRIQVDGMAGALAVRSGSGAIRVTQVEGDSVSIRTGSGSVTGDGVAASLVRVRTGSGGIRMDRSAGRDVHLQTGSGSVTAELVGAVDTVRVRTGSGGVTLHLFEGLDATVGIRTGSGRIETDFPILVRTQARRELSGVIGEGRGTIQVNTGSGSVRLRSL
jgi:lia operon protein LiaG